LTKNCLSAILNSDHNLFLVLIYWRGGKQSTKNSRFSQLFKLNFCPLTFSKLNSKARKVTYSISFLDFNLILYILLNNLLQIIINDIHNFWKACIHIIRDKLLIAQHLLPNLIWNYWRLLYSIWSSKVLYDSLTTKLVKFNLLVSLILQSTILKFE